MDFIYALGIKCILYVQQQYAHSPIPPTLKAFNALLEIYPECHLFADGWKEIFIEELDWFLESMHFFNSPYNVIEYIVPFACAVDSVLGAQLLLSVAFGSWANTMLKWMLAEDRPYWWVRETTYYDNAIRPVLRQSPYTCETSPGSPSGHCATASTVYLLSHKWVSLVMEEMSHMDTLLLMRTKTFLKLSVSDIHPPQPKHKNMTLIQELLRGGCEGGGGTSSGVLYRGVSDYQEFYSWLPHRIIFFFVVMNSCLARMHAGAHFPHQCLFGAMLGALLSPTVCKGVIDPFLSGDLDPQAVKRRMLKHALMAVAAGVIALFLGFCYVALGVDIHWGTRLAFRWCESVESINVKATPIFSVTQSVASLLGWALSVTPEITKFRYSAPNRNNTFFLAVTPLVIYAFYFIQEKIPSRRIPFYLMHFGLNMLKPFVYFQVLPKLSTIFTGAPTPAHGLQAN